MINIYVGNLAREVTEPDLRAVFEAHGAVQAVAVIKDKFSGESRGFGFVEMTDKAQGEAAIAALHGHDLKGRKINVNEAKPRTDNDRRRPR